ncbi:PREDICTED: major facilitator superfamily domain-containing protein 10-like [Amphimedon queenslandica]|uniref:Major facilitator superfamily (MFS) profile domain-containing protein n=1 Tax=Amphimedon queenslandica TaxID=400682 RepID=A0A1X7VL40_AMPQE|nr:PREDICTED: major facilitator superfamily domain-containing protein 10-like [Amphimedon queenslandica]|eukprot:XP_003383919.1 PREDICTED: major facilitator superfamily domain-containing protein 10-like [Amphimedon queenslandica]
MKRTDWAPVIIIFISLVVDLLGFTVILPLLPSMLEYYGSNDESGLYNATLSSVNGFRVLIGAPDMERLNIVLFGGLIGSLYSVLQFFSLPIIGTASDVFGRKPMLLITTLGVASSYVLWSVSYSFPVFILARVVAGLSKGIVSLSIALVTDSTTSDDRPKAMGIIAVAFSVGYIFGPLIGAYFSTFARSEVASGAPAFSVFQYPALFSCVTSVLVFLLIGFFLKETLPPIKRAKSLGSGLSDALSLVNPLSLFRYTAIKKISNTDIVNLRWMSFSYFLYLMLFSGLEQTLTFLLYQRFQYTRMEQGKMFMMVGLVMAMVQGGYMRRRPAGTEKRTALTGMAVILPGMLLIGWSSTHLMLYSGLLLYSFGAGTVVACFSTMASRFGESDEKGKILGIFRSIGALSRAFGPFLACTLYWSYGPCICYMVGGLAIVVPMVILAKVRVAQIKVE